MSCSLSDELADRNTIARGLSTSYGPGAVKANLSSAIPGPVQLPTFAAAGGCSRTHPAVQRVWAVWFLGACAVVTLGCRK